MQSTIDTNENNNYNQQKDDDDQQQQQQHESQQQQQQQYDNNNNIIRTDCRTTHIWFFDTYYCNNNNNNNNNNNTDDDVVTALYTTTTTTTTTSSDIVILNNDSCNNIATTTTTTTKTKNDSNNHNNDNNNEFIIQQMDDWDKSILSTFDIFVLLLYTLKNIFSFRITRSIVVIIGYIYCIILYGITWWLYNSSISSSSNTVPTTGIVDNHTEVIITDPSSWIVSFWNGYCFISTYSTILIITTTTTAPKTSSTTTTTTTINKTKRSRTLLVLTTTIVQRVLQYILFQNFITLLLVQEHHTVPISNNNNKNKICSTSKESIITILWIQGIFTIGYYIMHLEEYYTDSIIPIKYYYPLKVSGVIEICIALGLKLRSYYLPPESVTTAGTVVLPVVPKFLPLLQFQHILLQYYPLLLTTSIQQFRIDVWIISTIICIVLSLVRLVRYIGYHRYYQWTIVVQSSAILKLINPILITIISPIGILLPATNIINNEIRIIRWTITILMIQILTKLIILQHTKQSYASVQYKECIPIIVISYWIRYDPHWTELGIHTLWQFLLLVYILRFLSFVVGFLDVPSIILS